MAVGKTTVGRMLADDLGWTFIDSDQQLLAGTGLSGREIAHDRGVQELHRLEWEMLESAMEREGPAVIAAAASVIDRQEARRLLSSTTCVWLIVEPIVGELRLSNGSGRRRVMPGEDLAARSALFAEVADLTVDTTNCSPGDCVVRIREGLGL